MNNSKLSRLIIYAALVVVVAVVVWSFMLVGSPVFNRQVSQDLMRLGELESLKRGVDKYYKTYQVLPVRLADIGKLEMYERYSPSFADPVTGRDYEYRVLDKLNYQLCAEFERSSDDNVLESPPGEKDSERWRYNPGLHCFSFLVSSDDLPKK